MAASRPLRVAMLAPSALVALLALSLGIAGCSSGAVATAVRRPVTSPVRAPSTAPAPRGHLPPSTAGSRHASSAVAARVVRLPPLSLRARRAGLLDVRAVVPDALVNLRYASTNNFTHVRLYPRAARCLVHRTMAPGLRVAAARLRAARMRIVFWDCYRPHAVQVQMFRIVPNPNWVARPGPYARSHEAARSVDITLARASTSGTCAQRVQRHCLLAMGTGFDNFTSRAHAYATRGVSARVEANRAHLRHALAAGGLSVYSGEWWHFDGPGAGVNRPQLDAPLY